MRSEQKKNRDEGVSRLPPCCYALKGVFFLLCWFLFPAFPSRLSTSITYFLSSKFVSGRPKRFRHPLFAGVHPSTPLSVPLGISAPKYFSPQPNLGVVIMS